jgi:hypothetical protein
MRYAASERASGRLAALPLPHDGDAPEPSTKSPGRRTLEGVSAATLRLDGL